MGSKDRTDSGSILSPSFMLARVPAQKKGEIPQLIKLKNIWASSKSRSFSRFSLKARSMFYFARKLSNPCPHEFQGDSRSGWGKEKKEKGGGRNVFLFLDGGGREEKWGEMRDLLPLAVRTHSAYPRTHTRTLGIAQERSNNNNSGHVRAHFPVTEKKSTKERRKQTPLRGKRGEKVVCQAKCWSLGVKVTGAERENSNFKGWDLHLGI